MVDRWYSRIIMVCLCLILFIFVVGGGTPIPDPTAPPTAALAAPTTTATAKGIVPTELNIGTSSSISGSWYNYGIALSQVIKKYTGITSTPQLGGSAQNSKMMVAGKWYMCMGATETAYMQTRNIAPWDDKTTGILAPHSTVLVGPTTPWQMLVRKNSGINNFGDLKGKRVIYDYPGLDYYKRQMAAALSIYGLTLKDIKAMKVTSAEECAKLVVDGKADAFTLNAAVNAAFMEAFESAEMDLVGFASKEDFQKALHTKEGLELQKVGYIEPAIIPAKSYKGLDHDVIVFKSGGTALCIHKDINFDVVYKLTKAILEHPKELADVYAAAGDFNVNNGSLWIKASLMPYHPGAIKALKEMKAWPANGDELQLKALKDSWFWKSPDKWLWGKIGG